MFDWIKEKQLFNRFTVCLNAAKIKVTMSTVVSVMMFHAKKKGGGAEMTPLRLIIKLCSSNENFILSFFKHIVSQRI